MQTPHGLKPETNEKHIAPMGQMNSIPTMNVATSSVSKLDTNLFGSSVFLFYPNLIGYGRIVLALQSFYMMPSHPWQASFFYFLSAILDAFDGYLARKYNQSSRFGAMLDQLTDRCAFLGLLMVLCHFYPDFMFYFQFVAVLDVASHWLHLHAGDLTGKVTHKASSNPILNYYYTSKEFLFAMCFGNEAFYGLLYVAHFWPGPSLYFCNFMSALAALAFPVAALKSAISLIHLVTASQAVAEHDQELIQRREQAKKLG